MSEEPKKLKTVSFSQFTNWWSCPHRWMRDYILHEKKFEDNLAASFGTAIHEAIQNYLKTLYYESEEKAESLDLETHFASVFKREVDKKKIPHTQEQWDEFIADGKYILSEFKDPMNRIRYFPRDKWELLAIEDDLNETIINNVNLNAKLDIVLREKLSGNIRIVDFKTSGRGWRTEKDDFTKTSQLVLYKAVYSKKYNVPLSKIEVEFFILKRKLYDESKVKYEQSRLQIFKPSAYKSDVMEVIGEFKKFVNHCFTPEGVHNTTAKYLKNPGKNKKHCKYCTYAKNGTCDKVQELE